jgi:ribosomal protein S8
MTKDKIPPISAIQKSNCLNEIAEVLEKYGFIESKPLFLYEFGEEGPTNSQLESAEQDFIDRIEEHEKQINEALTELFDLRGE